MGQAAERGGRLPGFLEELLSRQYEEEAVRRILSGYAQKRKVTLRVNTLKASAAEIREILEREGIAYRTVPWYEDALILEEAQEGDLRKLSVYEEGRIYLQSLSSMLPPIALGPRAGADILDMTAAPGGKTTQMAALSGNKAHITACEMNAIRADRLRYNVEKQGAKCVSVMQTDARRLDDFFAFDQILLDAPCSGSGVLDLSDPKLGEIFTGKLIDKSVKSQRELLAKAVRLLKKGQQMVYSTCSVLACENEDVILAALAKKWVKVVPIETGGWQGLPLLPVKLEGTVCIAPDDLFEGFYLAKLEKL